MHHISSDFEKHINELIMHGMPESASSETREAERECGAPEWDRANEANVKRMSFFVNADMRN